MALYVVATPIGNLEDISPRALRVLSEVSTVLCEDTRVSKKLFAHFDIHTPLSSFHAHTTDAKFSKILDDLKQGKDYALVSDAGTPGISDPGARLVGLVKEQFGDDVPAVSVPGPSALTAALSVSGLPASDFLFLGFLPRKKGRQTLFEEIENSKRTVAFYESPHRVVKTLESLENHLAPERLVVLAREISKMHEDVLRGSVRDVLEKTKENPYGEKGEFVVMVAGK